MIVESIRLQHIKSYGAGPDGRGVTVAFQPGVNRIAGANGCGKTTLVEALGYALFGASPLQFVEENFRVETYLLAQGAKAGEIDVTFAVDNASYRLERGVGQASKRRSKVVDLADDSICAEGEREVENFVSALLKLPSPDRLRDLFCKLAGVKQGRLATPFDSSPKNARDFFEPLLEVDVFGRCFGHLKPVVDAFKEAREECGKQLAGLAERLRERADAGEKFEAARVAAEEQAIRLTKADTAFQDAQKERARHESLEHAVNEAARERDAVAADARVAAQRRQEAEGRVGEAESAVSQAAASEPGHRAYRDAEAALEALEERRKTRDGLLRKRETASAKVTALENKRDAAREQRDLLLRQHAEKRTSAEASAGERASLNEALNSTAAAFEREQGEAAAVAELGAVAAASVKALPRLVARMTTLSSQIADAAEEVSGWDAATLLSAAEERRRCEAALQQAREAAARSEARVRTLREQLERLADGFCPFLGQRCEQFDPAKVQEDASQLEAGLAGERLAVQETERAYAGADARHRGLVEQENRLKEKRDRLARDVAQYGGDVLEVLPASASAAVQALAVAVPAIAPIPAFTHSAGSALSAFAVREVQGAVASFAREVASWWPSASTRLRDAAGAADRARTERAGRQKDAENLEATVRSLEDEVRQLGEGAERKEQEARRFEGEVASYAQTRAALDESLKAFEKIDVEVSQRRQAADAHKADYLVYLRAKPLADDLESRRKRLEQLKQEEETLVAKRSGCEERANAARAAFDPAALTAAKAECETCSGEVAGAKAELQHARDERDKQKVRFLEWQEAADKSALVQGEIARHTAALEVTELARNTLKNAAPAVAQHLCSRIAQRAQTVYNQINPDPLELEWDSTHYSLRITPGDRRFAMLSGGEQTKLALAMTLAMVEEFSRLRFCIFDEPTYGVDADSRRKLADAILQLQDAAGLHQLLLVSHDDAFEGRIEHTVLLTKSASGGTSVEVQ